MESARHLLRLINISAFLVRLQSSGYYRLPDQYHTDRIFLSLFILGAFVEIIDIACISLAFVLIPSV